MYGEKFRLAQDNKVIDIVLFFTICAIFSFSNIRIISVSMQMIFVLAIFIYVLKTKKVKFTIHFLWMSTFIMWGLVTSLFAYNMEVAFNDVLNLSLKLLFYTTLITYIDNKEKLYFLLKAIAISGFILSLRILIGTPADVWGTERLGANLDLNPNTIGLVVSYASISSIFLAKTFKKKSYYLLIVPFIIIALLTGSRKAFLILIGGISMMKLLYIKSKKNIIIGISILSLLIYGVFELAINIPMFYNVLGKRLEGLTAILSLGNSVSVDASTLTRITMIEEAWGLFKQKPLMGYGLENFRLLSMFESYAHNNYMELLSSTGIVGVIIYYSFPVGLLIFAWINKIKYKDNKYNVIIVLLSTILIMDFGLVSYKQLITHILIVVCICFYLILNKYSKSTVKDNINIEGKEGDGTLC